MGLLDSLFDINNKNVLVTGASGQLGRTICEELSACGATVIGLDIDKSQNIGDKVNNYTVDITKKYFLNKTFNKIYKKHKQIDILINNAGASTFEKFEERSEKSFEWVMNVNLKGTFFCTQAYINKYDQIKQKKGSIINIGSIYGIFSPDFRIYTDCDRKNSEVYGATKAGIIQMTKYFAVHLADRNIRVNAVSPGGIFNPQKPQGKDFIKNYAMRCPMKRMANVEEIIGAIIYLSSDSSSYTTGQNITIDGGMSCW